MTLSRPPSPPPNVTNQDSSHDVPISVEISIERVAPERSSSTDSASSGSSRKNSMSRKPSIAEPTNTLIITPLPLPFFEPKILDALRSHFASFSTTFLHRRSPYSPVSVPGPGASIKGEPSVNTEDGSTNDEEMVEAEEESPEGDLYSFVPLKSFRRAIVVYYSAEDAERARIASDRLYIPETPKCPAITLRAFRAPETVLVEEGWFSGGPRKTHPAISDDAEEGAWYFGGFPVYSSNFDEGEIKESPFHLRPPVPERNFLISPPGSPPVGWVAIREDPPNEVPLAEDLMEALERLKAQSLARRTRKRRRGSSTFRTSSRSRSRSQERGSQSSGASLSHTDEEQEGVMLIPESAAGLSIRVENWSTQRLVSLHQAREKRRRTKSTLNHSGSSKDTTDGYLPEAVEEEAGADGTTGSLSEMEEELDRELDDGRYRVSKVEWNRVDHSKVPTSQLFIGDDNRTGADQDMDSENIPIRINPDGTEEFDDPESEDDDRYLGQHGSNKLGYGGGTRVSMSKLGMKPKPARMPPTAPSLNAPGSDLFPGLSNSGRIQPTGMPPLKPTAMPPIKVSTSSTSFSSTAVEPSSSPRPSAPGLVP